MNQPNHQPMKCPRILVVEDDHDQRELIVDVLDMYFDGADADHIAQAASAAECLAFDPSRFDVVLLDYRLPDQSGLEVLDAIVKRADVPVIFVTGENVTTTAAEAIRRGAQDYVIKLGDYLFAIPMLVEKNIRQHRIRQENQRLHGQLQATLEEVRVKNLQLQESLAEVERLAGTDYLTGLVNRRSFAAMLEHNFSEASRYDYDLSCVMIDLDHYKTLNDTLGHQMGDRILIQTAEVIRANLRTSDVAARYGGDEFVLLLPHTSLEMAVSAADRIRRETAAGSIQYLKTAKPLTLSMGAANLLLDRPLNADALVAMADRALYAAKEGGKDRIVTHQQMNAAEMPR